jgi:uncharacterized protein
MIRPILLALTIALPAPASADTREERLALARSYVSQALADMDVDRIVRQMYAPLLAEAEQRGVSVSAAQKAEIDALYMSRLKQPLIDILLQQDEIMADLLTLEEVKALADFYATPAGRSVMTKMPAVMERQQPQIMAFVQGNMPSMMPEILRILKIR